MIGASGEQLDIFNEVWYCMLLNNGQAAKGMIHTILSPSNPTGDFLLTFASCVWISAIEVLKKRIKSREGIPFLWRLLVYFSFVTLDLNMSSRTDIVQKSFM